MKFFLLQAVFLFLPVFGCNHPLAKGELPDYSGIKAAITGEQFRIRSLYSSEISGERKDSLIKEARQYIFREMINRVLPAWYGTPWAFEGNTTEPQNGSIACGYFVTTALRDAGFNLPRIKWAQLPSETMIKNMADKNNIRRYSHVQVSRVEEEIRKSGEGLYIAGLDIHVGFVVNTGNSIMFVHSNYYEPAEGVMAQTLNSVNPFRDSKYRVIGKILSDEMVRRWITGENLGL